MAPKWLQNGSQMAPKWLPGGLPEEGRDRGASFCKNRLPVYTGARFSKPGYHGTGSALVWYALACLLCCLSCGYALAYLLCCLSCAHWRWFLSPGPFLSCATLPSFLSPEASLARSAHSPRRLELGSFEMVLKVVSEALPRNFQNAARKENAASKGTETNVLRRPSFVARSSFVVRRRSSFVVRRSSFVRRSSSFLLRRSSSSVVPKFFPKWFQNLSNMVQVGSRISPKLHEQQGQRRETHHSKHAFEIYPNFIKISGQMAPKWLQNGPKMVQK